MADDTQGTGSPQANGQEPNADGAGGLEKLTPNELIQIIRETRTESAERRLELKRLREERAIEQARRDAEEAKRLAEQGEYKKLAEQYQAERESLRPVEQEVEQLREAFKVVLEKRLQGVPEHIRALLDGKNPVEALRWLEENADKVNPRQAPNMDAGQKGGSGPAPLSDIEAEIARRMGLSPEKMAKAKPARG